MFQVVYEYLGEWPQEGALKLEVPPLNGEITISPDTARRRAKGYLTCEVGMTMRPGEAMLVWSKHPVWRMSVYLFLRGYGQITALGEVDVDAATGQVIPLSTKQIDAMQDRADELASRLTPAADPAG
jgi:hypothetical protein